MRGEACLCIENPGTMSPSSARFEKSILRDRCMRTHYRRRYMPFRKLYFLRAILFPRNCAYTLGKTYENTIRKRFTQCNALFSIVVNTGLLKM